MITLYDSLDTASLSILVVYRRLRLGQIGYNFHLGILDIPQPFAALSPQLGQYQPMISAPFGLARPYDSGNHSLAPTDPLCGYPISYCLSYWQGCTTTALERLQLQIEFKAVRRSCLPRIHY